MTLKEEVYHHYLNLVNEKIEMLQKSLDDLRDSSANETKSTAGDKHETALAMLQIEQANVGTQLETAREQKSELLKINPLTVNDKIRLGSLISTDAVYFFICTALGKAIISGKTVFALSLNSPLGIKMSGKSIGESVELQNKHYRILKCE